MQDKFFTLEEARGLIPQIKKLFIEANDDLSTLAEAVQWASQQYHEAEQAMDSVSSAQQADEIRTRRKSFASAIELLSNAQQNYIKRFKYWIEKISSLGVIVRDLRDGLIDFPAREKGFEYLLCWRMGEDDVCFWHLESDGFMGRKPIGALLEYC